jgi:hypothetical protein
MGENAVANDGDSDGGEDSGSGMQLLMNLRWR